MNGDVIMAVAAFGSVSSLVALVFLVLGSRNRQIDARLADAARPAPDRAPPWASAVAALSRLGAKVMPEKKAKIQTTESQLVQAGFYRQHASSIFAAMRFLLFAVPIFVGITLGSAEILPFNSGVLYGIIVGLAGTFLPGMVIKRIKKARQQQIRRALPDTLDVMVICLEGGLSLPASFARVAEELGAAFPLLAREMNIVRKQIELGQSTAGAFREFADRFDVEELRSLALLIAQAEKYGASLVKTMRIQADSLRLKRYQWAEAMAQKAPLKLIFPTVLCIFPALYIVLMGPAFVQLFKALDSMGH